MSLQRKYEQKQVSAASAIEHIEQEQDIITPIITGEPPALLDALPNHEGLYDNRLFQMLSSRPILEIEEERLKIISMFLGKDERRAFKEGKIDLLPNHFSDTPALLEKIARKPAIMATVSPMDDEGYFSLGTNCDYTAPLMKSANTILLEVNDQMPRTYGENRVHIDEVTAIVENSAPLPCTPKPAITERDATIGGYVSELIHNGDVLQFGFGAIPSAVLNYLGDHRNLSIATEMIPDSIVDLFESGAINNLSRKNYQGKTTATFAYGTKRLYDFMHENKDIYMLPVHKSNNIRFISDEEKIVTINATVEVDFLGQCNSEKVGDIYWSSTGGQAEFGIGSRMAKHGRGIICLHSTVKNDEISKIVPAFASGTPVSTSKNDVNYIVTEYGIADIHGKTIRERTKELIRIAHPKFRAELEFEAKKMGYLL